MVREGAAPPAVTLATLTFRRPVEANARTHALIRAVSH